ncbi:hypothetical protein QNJ39_10960, partial [Macrococcus caseolyticus]|uniref:hypothetical protein n=1 Tax=Macrococcoides caseolyticum TaxID=69966 RepID=UPI0024BC383A
MENKENKDYLSFTPNYHVVQFKTEKMLPVSESDWNELKSEINSFSGQKDSIFSKIDFGQLLIGAFISSLFSLLALYNSYDVNMWLFIVNWVITITTFLVGISFLLFNKEKEE